MLSRSKISSMVVFSIISDIPDTVEILEGLNNLLYSFRPLDHEGYDNGFSTSMGVFGEPITPANSLANDTLSASFVQAKGDIPKPLLNSLYNSKVAAMKQEKGIQALSRKDKKTLKEEAIDALASSAETKIKGTQFVIDLSEKLMYAAGTSTSVFDELTSELRRIGITAEPLTPYVTGTVSGIPSDILGSSFLLYLVTAMTRDDWESGDPGIWKFHNDDSGSKQEVVFKNINTYSGLLGKTLQTGMSLTDVGICTVPPGMGRVIRLVLNENWIIRCLEFPDDCITLLDKRKYMQDIVAWLLKQYEMFRVTVGQPNGYEKLMDSAKKALST